jgi:hypothetical protein
MVVTIVWFRTEVTIVWLRADAKIALGLYSALRACRAMVLRSSRQSRLTVATKFCSTGTIPLIPCCWPAPGVAAGVAGIAVACPLVCPLVIASFASEGGVRSPAPPGKERDWGDVKAFACSAVDGWELRDSITSAAVADGSDECLALDGGEDCLALDGGEDCLRVLLAF